MNAIIYAARAGYTPESILHALAEHNPKYKKPIQAALLANYTAESILDRLSEDMPAATPHQRGKRNIQNARKEGVKNLASTALGIAGVTYGLTKYAQAGQAIRPSQIFGQARRTPPPTPRGPQGGTINVPQPPGLPAPQGQLPAPRGQPPGPQAPRTPQGPRPGAPNALAQLPYNPQQAPTARAQPPAPNRPINAPTVQQSGPPIATPYEHNADYNVGLVKNLKLDKKLGTILGSGLTTAAAEQVIRDTFPRGTLAILDKAEGGLPQLIEDYQSVLQRNQSRENKNAALKKFNERMRKGLVERERERFDAEYGQDLQPELELEPVTEAPRREPIVEPTVDESEGEFQEVEPVDVKVQQAVRGEGKLRPLEDYALRKEAFAIADYKKPGEDPGAFKERKIINDAIKKAAKMISEGGSFLDILGAMSPEERKRVVVDEYRRDRAFSTAADVLRFLSGVPNVYDPLLNEQEKQELFDGLLETGDKTVEGLRPTPGEQNVYGAPMSPNLVWNMLLAIEPKLQHMKIPRLTGFETPKDNAKMKRMLSHQVYGVLSGKTISTELADKIERISQATSGIDAIIKAAKMGNQIAMEREMERLMDDDYFAQALAEVMTPEYIDPSVIHQTEENETEDEKNLKYFKSRAAREKKKLKDNPNEH